MDPRKLRATEFVWGKSIFKYPSFPDGAEGMTIEQQISFDFTRYLLLP